jgi:hypothetical protein
MQWFSDIVLGNGQVIDKVSIYRRDCKLNKKPLYCFYAAPLGVQHTEKEGNWFDYFNDAVELLKNKFTRRSALVFTCTTNVTQGDEATNMKKRKRP